MKETTSYNALGTIAAPVTLTDAYSGNRKVLFRRGMAKIHLNISYTPLAGQTNRYVDILVETSQDGTNFFPMTVVVPTVIEIGDYVSGTDSTMGIPVIFPGDKTSTGGVVYTGIWDGELVSDWVRFSARESGSANFGTLYLGANFQS